MQGQLLNVAISSSCLSCDFPNGGISVAYNLGTLFTLNILTRKILIILNEMTYFLAVQLPKYISYFCYLKL